MKFSRNRKLNKLPYLKSNKTEIYDESEHSHLGLTLSSVAREMDTLERKEALSNTVKFRH